jgi:hypothetical protein
MCNCLLAKHQARGLHQCHYGAVLLDYVWSYIPTDYVCSYIDYVWSYIDYVWSYIDYAWSYIDYVWSYIDYVWSYIPKYGDDLLVCCGGTRICAYGGHSEESFLRIDPRPEYLVSFTCLIFVLK